MSWGWIIVTALLIAIYCFVVYIRRVLVLSKNASVKTTPGLSLLFLVKNQQDIIEGLLRAALAGSSMYPVEIAAVDLGSVDQTGMVLERLARRYPNLRFLGVMEEPGVAKWVCKLCQGQVIYCFDLIGVVNYNLMAKTIRCILHGSRASLYRTRVLYKNGTLGRCHSSLDMIK